MTKPVKRIAVIGAGASGMVQLKNLLDVARRPDAGYELEVVVYESKQEVGGVWYSDEQEKPYRQTTLSSEKGKERMYFYPPESEDPSPMYEGLHTNLPHELMAYRDFPFPADTPLFPDRAQVQRYLEGYATHFDLRRHIRFRTKVERLHRPQADGPWVIETATGGQEEYDNVCVANGHYADGWVPDVDGLGNFKGEVIHSRYYLRPQDYVGKTVLVVGSFASGSDIARQIAGLNVGKYDPDGRPLTPPGDGDEHEFTRVYVSSSGGAPSTYSAWSTDDPNTPWMKYIGYRPLISHIDTAGKVVFQDDGGSLGGIDTLIFATGYNFSLPFCKADDQPWRSTRMLEETIKPGERSGGAETEEGGLKGMGMEGLDQLLLFLENDSSRSIAFPTLQYQIVPFPLAETQTRLTALLWSGLLPSLPDDLQLPSNADNPYSTPAQTPPPSGGPPVRKVVQMRKKLVFGAPYEFMYQEYLMSLMQGVDDPEWVHRWWDNMPVKRGWRADTGLRKRTLGY